ncbi:MAG TPA: hypothetical protein VE954_32610 [Oligoflexus sp.]|uniref:hypothetical protein n=1 Tax=Oligoflexus sp. TaxID=1971216 RepID=UPI002D2C33AE|nr:hypothetical protein [Oligoflexus sp.]HYX37871.1 hypothetical protein [Oligoflexus sp.]
MKIMLEFLESLGLGICLILAAPLSFFRRLDHLFQLADHAGYLMRQRLFAALLRARLDYRMGNYQQSVVLLGPVVLHLEQKLRSGKALPLKLRRLLCLLYSDMQKLYLLSGQVEEAVQVVIRAQQNLGIDRLPSNPDLDIRTAHVIRAGLAASKLLEEGGLATLMVRQGEEPIVSRTPPSEHRGKPNPRPQAMKSEGRGATIIEFPKPTR